MGEPEDKAGDTKNELSGTLENKEALLKGLVGITAGNPVDLEKAKKQRLAGQ